MAEETKKVLETEKPTVLADKGDYNGEEILACDESGIDAILPKTLTSGNRAQGLFDKSAFICNPENDTYQCPANETIIYRFSGVEKGKTIRRYWTSACPSCPFEKSLHQKQLPPY